MRRHHTPSSSASSSSSQAQSFYVKGPLGSFGASTSGSHSQTVGTGPKGPLGSAGFSGTQQYRLPNGQIVDVSFGNAFSSSGPNSGNAGTSIVKISNPDGTVMTL